MTIMITWMTIMITWRYQCYCVLQLPMELKMAMARASAAQLGAAAWSTLDCFPPTPVFEEPAFDEAVLTVMSGS
eukprot:COSAG01_NODE_17993_length_1107_cov_3.113095_1_plen_74_part_00